MYFDEMSIRHVAYDTYKSDCLFGLQEALADNILSWHLGSCTHVQLHRHSSRKSTHEVTEQKQMNLNLQPVVIQNKTLIGAL